MEPTPNGCCAKSGVGVEYEHRGLAAHTKLRMWVAATWLAMADVTDAVGVCAG